MLSLKELLTRIAPVNLSLQLRPLSYYSNSLCHLIDSFLSQINQVAVHKEKFAQVAKYLKNIKDFIIRNRTMSVSLPFAKHIDVFSNDLKQINELAAKCAEKNSNIINSISLQDIWNQFLIFWLSALKLVRFFDPKQYCDVVSLYLSDLDDLNLLKSTYGHKMIPQRLSEWNSILQLKTEDINLKEIKTNEFLFKTPFSFNFKVMVSKSFYSLEVFYPDTSINSFFKEYSNKLSQLIHPNIIPFFGSTVTMPNSILTPYYQNGTLQSHLHIPMLDENGQELVGPDLSPTQLSAILLDTARTLEYVHNKKFVHRNLTPGSIFISDTSNAVLSGMWNISNQAVIENQIPFSPYIAPELLLDPSCYNEKSDVYSFTFLVWELYMNEVPFGNTTDYQTKNEIVYHDLRPHLPSDPQLANFFICGWARNPADRPTMKEIVSMLEHQEILIPGTDTDSYASYVKSTRRSHQCALKGILQLQMNQLTQLGELEELTDDSIELLVNVYMDSQDSEMREYAKRLLMKYLDKHPTLSIPSLVHYCQFSYEIPIIQPRVISLCNNLTSRTEFINQLFSSIDPSEAIEIIIRLGLRESDCEKVLQEATTQPPKIAADAAKAVVKTFPNSPYIFDFAKKNQSFYDIALQHIKSFDNTKLNKMSKKIILFTDGATPEILRDLSALVLRLDCVGNTDFDPNCILFSVLAKNGFVETIQKFAQNEVYCTRFVNLILPEVIEERPDVALVILLYARASPKLTESVKNINILKIITNCVKLEYYHIALEAASKIKFTREEVMNNFEQASDILKIVEEKRNDEAVASSVLMSLMPFGLYSDWTEKDKIADTVSLFLQSSNIEVSLKALTFIVGFARNPAFAKQFATNVNLSTVTKKFLAKDSPSLAYFAIRFFACVAPFFKEIESMEMTIKRELDIGCRHYLSNPRIIAIIIQSFLHVQKQEWAKMIEKFPVSDFITAVETNHSANKEILALINQLKYHK